MTEFKTKQEYDNFLKGNEIHFSNKRQEGKFELFVCNECLSHFDDKKERDEHLKNNHNLTFDDVSSGNLSYQEFTGITN